MGKKYVYPWWQQSSVEKWEEIVKRVEKKEKFVGSAGFKDLRVVDSCGFCEEFDGDCGDCPLEGKDVCWDDPHTRNPTLFWRFVYEMRNTEPDFENGLGLARRILAAIRDYRHTEDSPELPG